MRARARQRSNRGNEEDYPEVRIAERNDCDKRFVSPPFARSSPCRRTGRIIRQVVPPYVSRKPLKLPKTSNPRLVIIRTRSAEISPRPHAHVPSGCVRISREWIKPRKTVVKAPTQNFPNQRSKRYRPPRLISKFVFANPFHGRS